MLAVDTSVSVPLMLRSHSQHNSVTSVLRGHTLRLVGHSLAETYSVLTRLPGDSRLTPSDAAELIEARFSEALLPHPTSAAGLHRELSGLGIGGGAVYDALVGLAARDHGLVLATRDVRARGTYALLGAEPWLLP